MAQEQAVVEQLAEGEVKFVNQGGADEGFDFDGDFFAVAFGGEDAFGGEIDEEVKFVFGFEGERVVGDCPAVFFEGGADDGVEEVA